MRWYTAPLNVVCGRDGSRQATAASPRLHDASLAEANSWLTAHSAPHAEPDPPPLSPGSSQWEVDRLASVLDLEEGHVAHPTSSPLVRVALRHPNVTRAPGTTLECHEVASSRGDFPPNRNPDRPNRVHCCLFLDCSEAPFSLVISDQSQVATHCLEDRVVSE